MPELIKLMKKFNMQPNKVYKSYLTVFPLKNKAFSDPVLSLEYARHNKVIMGHPIHIDFDIIMNRFVFIRFTNETHSDGKSQLGLNIQKIPNTNKNLVGQGFDKVYDLQNPVEKTDCLNFFNDCGKNIAPNLGINNFSSYDINYHNINKIEMFPDLFALISFQKKPLSTLPITPGVAEQIHSGHAAPLKLNETETNASQKFFWAQDQHHMMSKNKSLSQKERDEHNVIVQSMDAYKAVKKYCFPKIPPES